MCMLIVDHAPAARYPTVLAAIRDEMLDRPWDPPGRHWPLRPGLAGGLDRLAGGTWLAFDPAAPRVACVLNASGRPAGAVRRSRGELPLVAAAGAAVPGDLTAYDPFHLVVADGSGLSVLTWNGYQAHRYRPGPGTHVFVNEGRWTGPADRRNPRASRWAPLFDADRPDPAAGDWSPWSDLLDTSPPHPGPDDLLVRDEQAGWGSGSVTLLGFGAGRARYDFRPVPGDWTRIDLA